MASEEDGNEKIVEHAWDKKLPAYVKDKTVHGCVVSNSSFATIFPQYREAYIKESFPLIKKTLAEHGVLAELDLISGTLKVSTTKDIWDPYIILKARDLINLISRSVPFEQAVKALEDDVNVDIIKLGIPNANKERFIKRRERLIGPNGSTLKAIELLTNCYVQIQGNTCTALGSYKGLTQVRKIVQESMHNIHPIYTIKMLMIMRELKNVPNLKDEDWNRFLPKFISKNVKSKKPRRINKKKEYTPFPPPQPESKIDKQLASGEYFMDDRQKAVKVSEERNAEALTSGERQLSKRQKLFVPPEEPDLRKKVKKQEPNNDIDIAAFKKKLQQNKKRKRPDINDAAGSTKEKPPTKSRSRIVRKNKNR